MTNFANYNSCAVWNSTIGNVTTVGSNGGPSSYGTFDQCGNVQEIVNINSSIFQQNIVYKGGGWNSPVIDLHKSQRFVVEVGEKLNNLGFRLGASGTLNANSWALITNINNSGDILTDGIYGSVEYEYWASKYLVTNCEYAEFLNAIAKTDRYNLYDVSMSSSVYGGIIRSGQSGSYFYYPKNDMANKPVVFVSWYEAARYSNWLHNNKPSGYQDNSTTENGAYALNGICAGYTVPRNSDAKYFVLNENEWYKSAYYKGGGLDTGYWEYATQSNFGDEPSCVLANASGDGLATISNFPYICNITAPTTTTTTTTTTTSTTTTPQPVIGKCNNKQFSAIQLRRGSETDFIAKNPILASGEPAYAVDQKILKIGDGITPWTNLHGLIIGDTTGSGLAVFNTSAAFSGIPTAPTAPSGTNTDQIATTSFVRTEIENLYNLIMSQ